MKRILLVFSALLAFVACNKNNENQPEPFSGASYQGTVSVTYQGQDNDNPDIKVDVTKDETGNTLSITIYQIKFVPQMPVTVDVTIPGVAYSEKNGVVSFQGDNIIPLSGVVPVERYLVSGLSGTIQDKNCQFSLNFGSFPTRFTGTQK